jgi:hypothetical protein
MQKENFVKIEKVNIGRLSAQYYLTPTFRNRLNRNLTLLHRMEDLIVDLESLYQYTKGRIEEKEQISSVITKVRKISIHEQKDPREVDFRIPRIKKRTEIGSHSQVRNPVYLDSFYRSQYN